MDSIAILDFGSQYAQIIARRVREAQVYCELFPWDAPMEKILSIAPKGFILSGGPKSVYEEGAPYIQDFIFKTGLPILGICYGMQALTYALGGQVDPSAQREYGPAEIEPAMRGTMLDEISKVWMSHGDRITRMPEGFTVLARSGNSPFAALVYKAIGDQLVAVFVDTGLLRKNEGEQVASAFREHLGAELLTVDASDGFLDALKGVTEPEEKRRIVGEKFIRVFEEQAKQLGQPRFLVQGTIYPAVVESSAPDRNKAEKIKTHHNVGGLPKDMQFELVEPLRYLFKDEVRAVGEALGLPQSLVWRQPFPGPGLTVRCLGAVTQERVSRLRAADAIFVEELTNAGFLNRRFSGGSMIT